MATGGDRRQPPGEWQLCQDLVPGPECVLAWSWETYRFRVAQWSPGAGEPVYLPQMVKLGEWLP